MGRDWRAPRHIMDLALRQTGKLPEIDIAGTMFYVEVHWGQLRADIELMSIIRLNECEVSPEGDHYRFAFNTDTKQMVVIDEKVTEWPKDVIVVEIPGETKLDPYALARKHGIDTVEFVKSHPFEKELKGKIIPIKETAYWQMIEKNKVKQLLPKKSNSLGKSNKNRIQ